MDALMAAFVAALLSLASDRMAWLAALLGTRFDRKPLVVVAALTLAFAILNGIGVAGALVVRDFLNAEARALLLGFALLSAGGGAFFPLKPPGRFHDWKIGAFLASLAGALVLGTGDRTQFLTLAIAARSPLPWAAAVGGTLGSLVVAFPAALLGEEVYRTLPMRPIRAAIGLVFCLAGAIVALGALHLI